MTMTYTVARVGAAIRFATYWIPAILVVLGARKLAWFWPSTFDLKQGVVNFAIATAFVLICEHYLFGFRIAYNRQELIYRLRGLPFPREKRVAKAQMRRARYEAAARTDNKPWRFVEIDVEDHNGAYTLRINLTGFTAREVEAFLQWLPNLERHKVPGRA